MFGLMRARTCGLSHDEKEFRRLNYCGTCKVIGADFSAKARLLLNHDVIFLAELLTALTPFTDNDLPAQLQSRNCLSLPRGNVPDALRFAAATNVFLAGLKFADHRADGDFHLAATERLFRRELADAVRILDSYSFPQVEITALVASQTQRELNFRSLEDVIFPTAEATATVFREGARIVGRDDAAATMNELGFEFGRLIYLLDAQRDFEKDARRGKFNAFRAAFGADASRRRMNSAIRDAEENVVNALLELPIAEAKRQIFINRLRDNLARELGDELPVLKQSRRRVRTNRWENAVKTARDLTFNSGWKMPLAFVFVFVCALVVPAQTRDARSARECVELSFNLMFLGAFAATLVSFPKTLLVGNRAPQPVDDDDDEGLSRRCCNRCCDGCGNCDCCPDSCCDCCDNCGECCGHWCGCDCDC